MTVAAKVKETTAGLKGALATLEQMTALTPDPEAKQLLTRNNERIRQVVRDLEQRVGVLEQQEPQYKGF